MMAFEIALLVLFMILFGLILFKDEIVSFFEKRAKGKKETEEKAKPTPTEKETGYRKPARPEEKTEENIAPQKRTETKAPQATPPLKEAPLRTKPHPPEESVIPVKKEEAKPVEAIPEKARPETTEVKAPKKIPQKEYADFDNSRLLAMGLSQKDADDFVLELIGQIDEFIPQIEAAIESRDYKQVERLSHSLKGSATNLGTGGVADQLIDFNTYCKKGEDKETIVNYLNSLKTYQAKLKVQYT